ncbi:MULTISPECIES: hypothetical protein [unclassified Methanoculleus]|uniref:hypothetical protein n=1 Tax=unclassified Methanoculleus TaxID=2619537 RepID=UPI0025DA0796|nr:MULTISPECIES: hypothetical protein [unclassified Methanoculleus]MCK9318505.1 hypothetical protein [Methanoculleus sp.]MDD2253571.1 hypothetical protein [Methanoculleus sp.]MDD2788418.1 hypothetical protein [Methanoculleus sp.]MDD3215153.1 hypothetical protein [Methanoculleus sp.]MDD4313166.1 hypothetical protein [Methanoculleus sp.]
MDPDVRLSMMEDFFAAYAAGFNKALVDAPEIDVEATAEAFADCIIAADPNGVSCGRNGEEFRAQIPKGFEFYRSIGTKSMRVASLAVTPLDDYHLMAKVHWVSVYRRKDGSDDQIDFENIYFVQTIGEKPRIFGYITGDEQKLLRERGLIPQ